MRVAGSDLAQLESLEFSGVGARQGRHKHHLARVLERGQRSLDVVLQGLDHSSVFGLVGLEHNKGLDHHAALFIGHTNHTAFGHGRVFE